MSPDRKAFIVPLTMIAVGTGWLLTSLGMVPQIDWAWSLGLAVIGFLAFLLSGVDKVSVVIGSFFLSASLLSVLRQTGRLTWDVEFPLLVILLALLLLLAHLPAVPVPGWLVDSGSQAPPKK